MAVLSLCCCVGFFLVVSGGYSLVAVRRPLIAVASLIGGHGLWGMPASVHVAGGISRCGTWPHLLCERWHLPRSGVKLVSPALAGGLSTTELPGKSLCLFWKIHMYVYLHPHTHPYILKSLANRSYKKFFLSIKPNAFHFLRICKL